MPLPGRWAGSGGPVAGERDWLLARIAERPELTLRAIVAELAARMFKL